LWYFAMFKACHSMDSLTILCQSQLIRWKCHIMNGFIHNLWEYDQPQMHPVEEGIDGLGLKKVVYDYVNVLKSNVLG